MGNLFVGPFGLTDRFGTNISNYDLKYDVGFLDFLSQAAALFTSLIYHLVLMPVSALGLKAMELVMSPDGILVTLSNLYRRIVDPLFEFVSFPLLAVLAVGILFLYISIDTVRYTSSFRQDAERVIVGTALAIVAVVLARDPFGPVVFVLRSIRDIIEDITRGTDSLTVSTVDSFLAPITQALSFGQPIGDAACAERWSEALNRGMADMPSCVEPLSEVTFGMAGSALLGVLAAIAMLAFAGLAVFRMAIHLFGGVWRLAVIPYVVLATIVQRRKYVTITSLLGTAAAHFVMVIIVLVLSLLGPALFTAFMADIVSGGVQGQTSTARMAIGMVVMTLGYAAMTYLLYRVSQSTGAVARALRLSSQRSLEAHLASPVPATGLSMLPSEKDDIAAEAASTTATASKAVAGAVLGDVADAVRGTTRRGDGSEADFDTDHSGVSADSRGATDVTQDEAVATPFAAAEVSDSVVLDEDGVFRAHALDDDDLPDGSADAQDSGPLAQDSATAAERDLSALGDPMESRLAFRHHQFAALATGTVTAAGAAGSAIYGRAPLPGSGPVVDDASASEATTTGENAEAPASSVPVDDVAGDLSLDSARDEVVEMEVDHGSEAEVRHAPTLDSEQTYLPEHGEGQTAQEDYVDPGTGGRHRALDDEGMDDTEPRIVLPVEHGVLGGGQPVEVVVPAGAQEDPSPSPQTGTSTESVPPASEPTTVPARDYSTSGMSSVDRDMAFLETGDAPTAEVASTPTRQDAPALLGSVSTPPVSEDEVQQTAFSASVASSTYVAGRDAAIEDSRIISAAMGFGPITVVPSDDASIELSFEVTESGENIAAPKHDPGFGF